MEPASEGDDSEDMNHSPGNLGRLISLNSQFQNQPLSSGLKILIGRKPGCTIQLNQDVVSAEHCKIFVSPSNLVVVKDLSTNGTFINRVNIGKGNESVLKHGDILTIVSKDRHCMLESKVCYGSQDDEIYQYYDIGRELGRGNFSVVKLARNRATGDECAVKIVEKKIFLNENMNEDHIFREVEILKRVRHDNVVGYKDLFQGKDHIYIILELVSGGELFDLITTGDRITEDQARCMFKQMLSAIEHLHSQGVVHRDIKPENNTNGQVKISDFGLAKLMERREILTTLCGTPQYVAPEIIQLGLRQGQTTPNVSQSSGEFVRSPTPPTQDEDFDFQDIPTRVSARTGPKTTPTKPETPISAKSRGRAEIVGYGPEIDLWSLGVCLYALLSRELPFPSDDRNTLFYRIAAGQFEFPSPQWDGISESAKHLILSLLRVNPRERLTAKKALQHPWIIGLSESPSIDFTTPTPSSENSLRRDVAVKEESGASSTLNWRDDKGSEVVLLRPVYGQGEASDAEDDKFEVLQESNDDPKRVADKSMSEEDYLGETNEFEREDKGIVHKRKGNETNRKQREKNLISLFDDSDFESLDDQEEKLEKREPKRTEAGWTEVKRRSNGEIKDARGRISGDEELEESISDSSDQEWMKVEKKTPQAVAKYRPAGDKKLRSRPTPEVQKTLLKPQDTKPSVGTGSGLLLGLRAAGSFFVPESSRSSQKRTNSRSHVTDSQGDRKRRKARLQDLETEDATKFSLSGEFGQATEYGSG